MAAFGQQVTVGTATLIFACVDVDTYKANNYNPTDNPNIFIAGAATDPLPLLLAFPTGTIYLGGSNVSVTGSPHAGAAIIGPYTLAYNAVGGDSLYGIIATGSVIVSILAMRQ
jgi:hypothetical protein